MTDNEKMREAFFNAFKDYGPTISFSDFEMGWDACMEQAAKSVPDAELERLRKDAERYRWLRMKGAQSDSIDRVHYFGPKLDEAIDAAIATKKVQDGN